MSQYLSDFMAEVKAKNPNELEFHQAVQEVVESLLPVLDKHPEYRKAKIVERIVEPERQVVFRVPWVADNGDVRINRGYRIEFNSAIGPYKGGLRFHPSVTLSILKFLGFEQIFKNSLTTLPMGGGKGGSDFDPKFKSRNEIMRFCQSFMTELFRHIGANTDVPAGDIGVGGQEIGFLFGQYKRIKNVYEGVLTGKGINWGGSLIRPEATGFGTVYFANEMLKTRKQSFDGKTVCLSGFGNVAWGAAIKATELGAKVVTLSGPDGYIFDPKGVSGEKIDYMLELRATNQDVVQPYAEHFGVEFVANKHPWEVTCDIALPCATQNELNADDARNLIANGCACVCEGANMPTLPDAMKLLIDGGLLFGPAKAANAGGVATSGLEMSQNSMRMSWSAEEVDKHLHTIMKNIHKSCMEAAATYGTPGNYVNGANIAGFIKVADAMMAQGIV